jgi:hypothetical protein
MPSRKPLAKKEVLEESQTSDDEFLNAIASIEEKSIDVQPTTDDDEFLQAIANIKEAPSSTLTDKDVDDLLDELAEKPKKKMPKRALAKKASSELKFADEEE